MKLKQMLISILCLTTFHTLLSTEKEVTGDKKRTDQIAAIVAEIRGSKDCVVAEVGPSEACFITPKDSISYVASHTIGTDVLLGGYAPANRVAFIVRYTIAKQALANKQKLMDTLLTHCSIQPDTLQLHIRSAQLQQDKAGSKKTNADQILDAIYKLREELAKNISISIVSRGTSSATFDNLLICKADGFYMPYDRVCNPYSMPAKVIAPIEINKKIRFLTSDSIVERLVKSTALMKLKEEEKEKSDFLAIESPKDLNKWTHVHGFPFETATKELVWPSIKRVLQENIQKGTIHKDSGIFKGISGVCEQGTLYITGRVAKNKVYFSSARCEPFVKKEGSTS